MTTNQKLSLAAVTGLAIGLATAFLGYYFFSPKEISVPAFSEKSTPKKSGPVTLREAGPNLTNYRHPSSLLALYNNWNGKVSGVVHSRAAFDDYLKNYDEFVYCHPVEDGYEWQIGLYFNIVDSTSGTNPRQNIYFIPTMVDKQGRPRDFYELYKNAGFKDPYAKLDTCKNKRPADFIYDQGTLFP